MSKKTEGTLEDFFEDYVNNSVAMLITYYSKLIDFGVPKKLAREIVLQFHEWTLFGSPSPTQDEPKTSLDDSIKFNDYIKEWIKQNPAYGVLPKYEFKYGSSS